MYKKIEYLITIYHTTGLLFTPCVYLSATMLAKQTNTLTLQKRLPKLLGEMLAAEANLVLTKFNVCCSLLTEIQQLLAPKMLKLVDKLTVSFYECWDYSLTSIQECAYKAFETVKVSFQSACVEAVAIFREYEQISSYEKDDFVCVTKSVNVRGI